LWFFAGDVIKKNQNNDLHISNNAYSHHQLLVFQINRSLRFQTDIWRYTQNIFDDMVVLHYDIILTSIIFLVFKILFHSKDLNFLTRSSLHDIFYLLRQLRNVSSIFFDLAHQIFRYISVLQFCNSFNYIKLLDFV
jgi:hypothetical protein